MNCQIPAAPTLEYARMLKLDSMKGSRVRRIGNSLLPEDLFHFRQIPTGYLYPSGETFLQPSLRPKTGARFGITPRLRQTVKATERPVTPRR